ncbi:hypothetical protein EK21DRAFT_113075 [Setomelanomma holmii]|uniref:Rad51-like C-terminal domain-containing protein n=1 Tax=Setomelanomma holmii TaxID=210430 RepID=A0A9P4HA20_9PLEO|nr:hypothetical protein EK21DRAFT_113075 [Setomelanomma holmii]
MTSSVADGRPAEVLLASSLVRDEELDRLLEGACGLGKSKGGGEERLGTGAKSLDDALDGGLKGGKVTGIWEENGGGGMKVCRALLVSSLLKYPRSTAAVVDTTGNFDVLKLYTLILSRLQKDADALAAVRTATEFGAEDGVEDVAAKILDHVNIMRVFDFVGMREAIGEIRDDLEGREAGKSRREETRLEQVTKAKPLSPEPAPGPPEQRKQPVPKRTVVQDSEDEDKGEDEEEMLFDTSPPPAPAELVVEEPAPETPFPDTNPVPEVRPIPHASKLPLPPSDDSAHGGKPTFILLDNITQVLTPLLKRDSTHANALASTFLHTLSHLTSTHNLHTILMNPAAPPRFTSPARQRQQQEQRRPDPPTPPSVFASCDLIPNLLGVLGRYVDTGILVGSMPRQKIDARVWYKGSDGRGGGGGNAGRKVRGVEMCGVMEVLWDRWEGRGGGWGVLDHS